MINNGILTNPIVDIKLLNGHFTILGEVNSPGRYDFLTNNMDILQAIGIAGDTTINAVRTDVKLLRYTDNDKQLITSIDLTNPDFLNNDGFQIFSGDVVIVNPNNRKVKEAGLIEDSRLKLVIFFNFNYSFNIKINNLQEYNQNTGASAEKIFCFRIFEILSFGLGY